MRSTKFVIATLGLLMGAQAGSSYAALQDPKPEESRPDDLPKIQQTDTNAHPDATGENHDVQPIRIHLAKLLETIGEIKPDPRPTIPDPPPHEGALIDDPIVIQPPDLLVVEVLEALPGRPITGERLVRPDGTITLGFYGSVNVRGLTLAQAKTKIILHLRTFLDDEALGLIGEAVFDMGGPPPAFLEPRKQESPVEAPAKAGPPGEEKPAPNCVPAAKPDAPEAGTDPKGHQPQKPDTTDNPPAAETETGAEESRTLVLILPENSDRVFVDIGSYNHSVYYLVGEFAGPGRYPVTGSETVLDAINSGGGLTPDADRSAIKIVRPGRGNDPSRTYAIDLDAIELEGKREANLQLFAGDRLVVPRKPPREAERVGSRPDKTPSAVAETPAGFTLQGEFAHPGPLPVRENLTVLDAIQMGGGLTADADLLTLTLVRGSADGKTSETRLVNLKAIMEQGDTRTNWSIKPGDHLIVDRQPGPSR